MSEPRVIWIEDDQEQGHSTAAYEALWAGKVVIHPTDTVYGMLANIESEQGYKRIYEIKGRNFDKPLALLVHGSMEHARLLRNLLGEGELRKQFDSGELTVVVKQEQLPSLPSSIADLQPGTIGIRAPADNTHGSRKLRDLIEDRPVWATSVNRSGEPPATTADEVLAWLDELRERGIDSPELVVLSRTPGSGKPSNVIDLTGDAPKRLR